MQTVSFYEHQLGESELASLKEVFSQSILTTGQYTRRFESEFGKIIGAPHTVALNSCTGAMHLALLALGVGQGDEVITTPLSFIATSTAIECAGARPVFVDVDPDTGNLDVDLLEAKITERTKAILPVHLYGQMCDMERIAQIARDNNLAVVEDAAHCVEGAYKGHRPGSLSDAACFSFYATKNLACGEGGALSTHNPELAESVRLLSVHGMEKTAYDRALHGWNSWDMAVLGWKYNMSNIEAGILLPQLPLIDEKLAARQRVIEQYHARLESLRWIQFPVTANEVKHAWHLCVIFVPPRARDRIIQMLYERGIQVVVNYEPIHLKTYFKNRYGHSVGDFPITERLGTSAISLPFYPTMPEGNVDYVCGTLSEIGAELGL